VNPAGGGKTRKEDNMLDDIKGKIDTLVERMTNLRGYL
jgi:hypothetical protein